jgi:transposase InsO family protein
MWGLDLVGPL